jgi:hypothetical protein
VSQKNTSVLLLSSGKVGLLLHRLAEKREHFLAFAQILPGKMTFWKETTQLRLLLNCRSTRRRLLPQSLNNSSEDGNLSDRDIVPLSLG